MLSAIGDALSGVISWISTVIFGLVGVRYEYGSSTTIYHWHTGFDLLLPLFCLGIAASIIAFSVKILHRVSSHGR